MTLATLIYFVKAQLPQAPANRLIRLAAFQNHWLYNAQAMRMSVWDRPRVIGNAENFPQHIALTCGCLDAAMDLLRDNGIACDLRDERIKGEHIDVSFVGTLRLDQERNCRNAASRHRRAVRSKRLWQKGHCRRNDRASGCKHTGAGSSNGTAQAKLKTRSMSTRPKGAPGDSA